MSLLKDKIELGVEEAEFKVQKSLGEFSPAARWLLIITVLALLPGYFIAKKISLNSWTKSYQNLLLSAHRSFENPKDPTTNKISVTTTGDSTYSVVAEVVNENVDLSLSDLPYQFRLFDENKQEIVPVGINLAGKTFLLPNQTKYLIIPRLESQKTIKYVNLDFGKDLNWQKKLAIPKVPLITSTPNTYHQINPLAFVVEGNFYNNSPYSLQQVHLDFLVYNTDKNLIAASSREEFTVAPFERRAYKQMWPQVYASNLGEVKVVAETNTLDPLNLGSPALPSGNSSDLSRPKLDQQ